MGKPIWQLRKGGGKEVCPHCGQKRFVPFVLVADNTTKAGEEFGRCDREQNCGYYRYPDRKATDKQYRIEHKPTPAPIVFNKACVEVKWSALFDFAEKLIGQDVYEVWQRYQIGCAANGSTIFWYFDKNGICRSGKEIHYKADGHRDKAFFPPVTWAHKDLNFEKFHSGEVLLQPFFGEHLLNERPDAKVAIVESEKTAALMSAFYPNNIWLACGGSQGLKNRDKLKALKGRRVVLIPDHGQYWNWLNTATEWNFEIFDFCQKQPIFEGCDILDYYTSQK